MVRRVLGLRSMDAAPQISHAKRCQLGGYFSDISLAATALPDYRQTHPPLRLRRWHF